MSARMSTGTTQDGNGGRPLAWPGDPEGVTAADIDFTALAHVLANTCRFGGCTRRYHSLAAHAAIVSEEVEALDGLADEDRRRLALHALIAEAPSAWLRGETPGSQRAAERAGRLAAGIECAVREAAGLDPALDDGHAELLRFVSRMAAAAERRDLPDADGGAGAAFPPLRRRIRPVDPGRAAKLWLARFHALAGPPRDAGAGSGSGGRAEGTDAADAIDEEETRHVAHGQEKTREETQAHREGKTDARRAA